MTDQLPKILITDLPFQFYTMNPLGNALYNSACQPVKWKEGLWWPSTVISNLSGLKFHYWCIGVKNRLGIISPASFVFSVVKEEVHCLVTSPLFHWKEPKLWGNNICLELEQCIKTPASDSKHLLNQTMLYQLNHTSFIILKAPHTSLWLVMTS